MGRIALHGPQYSGKTTLAQTLTSDHDYRLINFTDHLKLLAATALSAATPHTVTVDDIKADKTTYRQFLQALGTLVGFDNGDPIPDMLEDTFDEYGADYPRLIFDNVRSAAQYDHLKHYGFILVRLQVVTQVQQQRGIVTGADHDIEKPMPHYPGEIILDGSQSPADLVYHLAHELEARGQTL